MMPEEQAEVWASMQAAARTAFEAAEEETGPAPVEPAAQTKQHRPRRRKPAAPGAQS